MRTVARVLIGITLIIAATGCPKRIQLSLYNNTGEDCKALLFGKSYKLAKASIVTTDYPTATGELMLQFTNVTVLYHVPPRPKPFEKVRPFDNLILLQVEKDFAIYVLTPTNERPASSFPPQPPGFPLKPSNERAPYAGQTWK